MSYNTINMDATGETLDEMISATKIDILNELAMLRGHVATIENAMVRSDAGATVDGLLTAVAELPDVEPVPEYLANDYATVRGTLAKERQMRMSVFANNPPRQRTKVAEIDSAGKALGRMAKALGLEVPGVIDQHEPEPQQAQLISVPAGR